MSMHENRVWPRENVEYPCWKDDHLYSSDDEGSTVPLLRRFLIVQ